MSNEFQFGQNCWVIVRETLDDRELGLTADHIRPAVVICVEGPAMKAGEVVVAYKALDGGARSFHEREGRVFRSRVAAAREVLGEVDGAILAMQETRQEITKLIEALGPSEEEDAR